MRTLRLWEVCPLTGEELVHNLICSVICQLFSKFPQSSRHCLRLWENLQIEIEIKVVLKLSWTSQTAEFQKKAISSAEIPLFVTYSFSFQTQEFSETSIPILHNYCWSKGNRIRIEEWGKGNTCNHGFCVPLGWSTLQRV